MPLTDSEKKKLSNDLHLMRIWCENGLSREHIDDARHDIVAIKVRIEGIIDKLDHMDDLDVR